MGVSVSSTDNLEDAIQGDAEIVGDEDIADESGTDRKGAIKGVAKGSTPRGQMNNTETRFSRLLDATDEVEWWIYEALRVRYGDKGWHTPDFIVLLSDRTLMVAEVKAHMTDAGRTRFKAGARALPIFRWVMYVQKGKRQPWTCKYDTEGIGGAPLL
jgi:hypothetical protein